MVEPYLEHVPLYEDDRGSVYCALDNIGDGGRRPQYSIKRTYVVHNWKAGLIRAWHGHEHGWTGLHVIQGVAKLIAKPIRPHESILGKAVILSDRRPGIFWVPPGYYNGSMSLVDNTKILVYSTLSFDEVKQDDVRKQLTDDEIGNLWKVKNR